MFPKYQTKQQITYAEAKIWELNIKINENYGITARTEM